MPINDSPLVSVIVPFLDGAPWLKEAIESVIAQRYTHWELILIDDGSGAEASAVARNYSDTDPLRIIYLEHEDHVNKGVSVSRNLGVSVARGSFIAFLDSDDKWLPLKLEKQLGLFAVNDSITVLCEASLFWYSWNDVDAADEIVYVGAPAGKSYLPGELLDFLYPFATGAPPCPTGIIMRKDAFERVGGFEPAFAPPYQLYEDQALLAKLYMCEPVYVSGEINNMYRKRAGSLTGEGDDEERYNMVRAFFFEWFGKKFPSSSRRGGPRSGTGW